MLPILKTHGYTKAKDPGQHLAVFEHKNGSKVVIHYPKEGQLASGEWTSHSPGHLTKTGSGSQLKALLEGKPGKFKNVAGISSPAVSLNKKSAAQAVPAKTPQVQSSPYKPKEYMDPTPYYGKTPHEKIYAELEKAAPNPSEDERKAISRYSGSAYNIINSNLRAKDPDAAKNRTVQNIDKYLEKSKIPENVTLFRGVSGNFLKSILGLNKGEIFVDHGYSSHTTKLSTAVDFAGQSWTPSGTSLNGAILVVNVPKGANGATIKNYSKHYHEHEILFKRGTKFKLKSFDPITRHIQVDMVID